MDVIFVACSPLDILLLIVACKDVLIQYISVAGTVVESNSKSVSAECGKLLPYCSWWAINTQYLAAVKAVKIHGKLRHLQSAKMKSNENPFYFPVGIHQSDVKYLGVVAREVRVLRIVG